jgi:cytochrome c oxidase cbb3-type subunit 2
MPPMYSAAWHHVHLFAPRSINPDSNMPAYRFLYRVRRIAGERSAEALQLSGGDAPPEGWEVVPTFDAKCVVAYLMGLNQSHPLKEVRSAGGAPPAGAAPSPPPAAQGASPAPAAGASPAAPKK